MVSLRNDDGLLPAECAAVADEHLALCLSAWEVLLNDRASTHSSSYNCDE